MSVLPSSLRCLGSGACSYRQPSLGTAAPTPAWDYVSIWCRQALLTPCTREGSPTPPVCPALRWPVTSEGFGGCLSLCSLCFILELKDCAWWLAASLFVPVKHYDKAFVSLCEPQQAPGQGHDNYNHVLSLGPTPSSVLTSVQETIEVVVSRDTIPFLQQWLVY